MHFYTDDGGTTLSTNFCVQHVNEFVHSSTIKQDIKHRFTMWFTEQHLAFRKPLKVISWNDLPQQVGDWKQNFNLIHFKQLD